MGLVNFCALVGVWVVRWWSQNGAGRGRVELPADDV